MAPSQSGLAGRLSGIGTLLVDIKFNAAGPFKELNGNILKLDSSKTWKEEILKHRPKISVDETKYSVRRTAANAPKHNLGENIKILVQEFSKTKGYFVVQIVENPKKVGPGPKNAPSNRSATANTTPARPSLKTQKINVKIAPAKKKVVKKEQDRPGSPDSQASAVSTATIRAPSGTKGTRTAFEGGQKRRAGNPIPGPASRKARVDNPIPNMNGNQSRSSRNGFAEDGIPTDARGQQMRAQLPNRDDDAESQCSQMSQGSQEALADHGIEYEDVKPRVVKKLLDYPNSGLLIIRKELDELKKDTKKWVRAGDLLRSSITFLDLLFLHNNN